jgi:cytochrome P450
MSSAVANTQRPAPLPPGPSGKPIVGSLLDAWDNPLKLMLRSFSEHGAVSRFKFLWIPYMLIADADAAHHVLVSNAKAYKKSPNYDGLKIMLGQGLLTSEGEFWKRQRKLAQPAFHREKLAGFVDVMAECAEAMVREWRAGAETFDLHRAMMRLPFRVVGKTLLSVDLDGEARAVGEALDVALEWTNDYVEAIVRVPPWVPTAKNRRFLRAKETLDRLVTKVVVDRRAAMARGERVPNDLLQMLLEARDGDTGEAMSDEQLKNELLTLVLAGHETTANALTFGLYLLSKHRDVRDKLRAEARAVLGDERAPTIADPAEAPVHAAGGRRGAAIVSAGVVLRAHRHRRRRGRRLSRAKGDHRGDRALRDASKSQLFCGPRALRPRALQPRDADRPTQARVRALWWWRAHVHRQRVRADGDAGDPADPRARVRLGSPQ